MSYQVIARKWRPQTFEELVGQKHVSQTLLNALRNDRLHHALLFTGPRGTGKTSSARILAKALRCPNAKDFIPCHECSECEDIAAGRSIDVLEIDGASNNGVDAIRELRDTVGYMPSSGKNKLYIIDEVHMLSTSAFNALLKTLEEPPSHVIFIMATTEAHKIPNTILSRCQRFDFRRISVSSISQRLKDICTADGITFEEEALWLIARQGDGSMRDSQSLLDQVITFCDNQVTQQKTIEVLGLTDRSLLLETLDSLIHQDIQRAIKVVEKLFEGGFETKIFVQDLLEEIRNLLVVQLTNTDTAQFLDLPQSEINRLKELGQKTTESHIHLLFDMCLKGASELGRSQDPRVVLEMLLLRMARAPQVVDLLKLTNSSSPQRASSRVANSSTHQPSLSGTKTHLSQNLKSSQTQAKPVGSGTHKDLNSSSTQSMSSNNSEESSPNELWKDLIEKIKRVNPMVSAKLEHTAIELDSNKKIKLIIPEKMKFLSSQVEDKSFQKKLLNYLNTFWGPGYSLDVETRGSKSAVSSPKALEEIQKQEALDSTRKLVENHPFVQSTQKVFKSQIKSIKEIP